MEELYSASVSAVHKKGPRLKAADAEERFVEYDFDAFVDRSGTDSLKWEFMQNLEPSAGPGTLPFWVADMDFACAPAIVAALKKRVERNIFGYSSKEGPAYYDAVCGWFRRRFGWDIDRADIFYSPGVVPALAFLIELLTKPGDGVIIQRPVYYPFSNMIAGHGRAIVNNALVSHGGRYEMDYADLEAKARDPRNKLLILCSPHNPVGRVWTRLELERLGRICLDNGVMIVSDEIHGDLVRVGQTQIPLVTLFPKEKNRIVTATAPSKTFNLAGLQLSNIVIHDPELKAGWKRYVEGELGLGLSNCFAITATEAAYTEGEDWLDALRGYLDGNIAFMADFFARRLPGVRFFPPQGTYLAWADLRGYGLPEAELLHDFCVEGGALLEAGSLFGPEGEGFVRINVACTREILGKGLEGMARVLEARARQGKTIG